MLMLQDQYKYKYKYKWGLLINNDGFNWKYLAENCHIIRCICCLIYEVNLAVKKGSQTEINKRNKDVIKSDLFKRATCII